jgi:hypothetical protein
VIRLRGLPLTDSEASELAAWLRANYDPGGEELAARLERAVLVGMGIIAVDRSQAVAVLAVLDEWRFGRTIRDPLHSPGGEIPRSRPVALPVHDAEGRSSASPSSSRRYEGRSKEPRRSRALETSRTAPHVTQSSLTSASFRRTGRSSTSAYSRHMPKVSRRHR